MKRLKATLTTILLGWLTLSLSVSAERQSGIVSRVIDGDTIQVAGQSVRLQGIDAPESDQHHGGTATAALKARALNRKVTLDIQGTDRYDRLIAVVYMDEQNLNRWLVQSGHAWEYDRYSKDPALGRLEAEARRADRGLWAKPDPMPPWQWRRGGQRTSSSNNSNRTAGPNRDCGDFRSQAAAQRFYERHQPGDPHRLDGNDDGEVCESLL